MVPEAPGRFSTITGCFIDCDMRSARIRAAASAGTPGDHGTMTRTGRDGYGSCAWTAVTAARQAAPNARRKVCLKKPGAAGLIDVSWVCCEVIVGSEASSIQ